MTDREKRERNGERALFAKYKRGEGDTQGRTYYSFTPSAVQFWGTLLLTLASILSASLGGAKVAAKLFLRPEIKAWVTEDFGPIIAEHSTFAKRSELEALSYAMRAQKAETDKSADKLAAEIAYMRQRIDAIADRVGAR